MAVFEIVDISGWDRAGDEPMGGKRKEWRRDPDGNLWLFKEVNRTTGRNGTLIGEDWAEKVVSELALLSSIPAARVELAADRNRRGCISASVLGDGCELVHGNELLWNIDPDYPKTGTFGHWYSVAGALNAIGSICLDPAKQPNLSADEQFAGYLVLDAWVSNTDRHHENWAVMKSPLSAPSMAPSFDHASSLGFQLSDDERMGRLRTGDSGYAVEAWADRGRSPFFEDGSRQSMFGAVRSAANFVGTEVVQFWARGAFHASASLDGILAKIPLERMSEPTKEFAARVLRRNLERLEEL